MVRTHTDIVDKAVLAMLFYMYIPMESWEVVHGDKGVGYRLWFCYDPMERLFEGVNANVKNILGELRGAHNKVRWCPNFYGCYLQVLQLLAVHRISLDR